MKILTAIYEACKHIFFCSFFGPLCTSFYWDFCPDVFSGLNKPNFACSTFRARNFTSAPKCICKYQGLIRSKCTSDRERTRNVAFRSLLPELGLQAFIFTFLKWGFCKKNKKTVKMIQSLLTVRDISPSKIYELHSGLSQTLKIPYSL